MSLQIRATGHHDTYPMMRNMSKKEESDSQNYETLYFDYVKDLDFYKARDILMNEHMMHMHMMEEATEPLNPQNLISDTTTRVKNELPDNFPKKNEMLEFLEKEKSYYIHQDYQWALRQAAQKRNISEVANLLANKPQAKHPRKFSIGLVYDIGLHSRANDSEEDVNSDITILDMLNKAGFIAGDFKDNQGLLFAASTGSLPVFQYMRTHLPQIPFDKNEAIVFAERYGTPERVEYLQKMP